jgi:hypothetical protein
MILLLAIVSGLLITCLLAFVEIIYQSKATVRACPSWPFAFYGLTLLLGNIIAAVLAAVSINSKLPTSFAGWSPIVDVFAGIFAFETVMRNTNISFFDKGILTIQDWIGKARDPAVASALKKQIEIDRDVKVAAAGTLKELPEKDLNTYIATYLKDVSVTDLENAADASGANRRLYKALELAEKAPDHTASILRTLRNKTR